ncbi:hypothetical protein [Modestobacter sp. Leaf380]|uniref:hypothetical protein n=1 Tax=Modestobacter sp. Leaf380 TaxID=1736356 RepID=UPI0012FC35CC|nr:hypothetical protein [Modestobacter sp. Leaf380]
MGKHTALDEAVVHPLVAQALQRRAAPGTGTHRPGAPNVVAALPPTGPVASAVGWPEAPGRGEGLGWPAEPEPATDPARDAADDGSVIAALEAADVAGQSTAAESETPRRAGWRRFFGGGHTSARSGTSAA